MARSAARKTEPALILPMGPPSSSDRSQTVDEFGRLSMELESVKALQMRHEQLRQRIAGWYQDSDPEATASVDGAQFSVLVGPKASKRSVTDMDLIFDRLGAGKFLSVVSISFEKLDTLMLPADQADCVTVERTGPRTIRPVPKFAEPVV
jgi:hypothetical protein